MADIPASDRPDIPAQFDLNDHCTHSGWATWATFCEGSGFRACWHRHLYHHTWDFRDAYPGYRRCRCGRAEHWYADGHHRYGSYDRTVWEEVQFACWRDEYESSEPFREGGA